MPHPEPRQIDNDKRANRYSEAAKPTPIMGATRSLKNDKTPIMGLSKVPDVDHVRYGSKANG